MSETEKERLAAERERWVAIRKELMEVQAALGGEPARTSEGESDRRLSLSRKIKELSPGPEEGTYMQELLVCPPTMDSLIELLIENPVLLQLNVNLRAMCEFALAGEYNYPSTVNGHSEVVKGDLFFCDSPLVSSDQTCRGIVCFGDHPPCNVMVVEVKVHQMKIESGVTRVKMAELRRQVSRAALWWAKEHETDHVYGLSILKVRGGYSLELLLPDGRALITDSFTRRVVVLDKETTINMARGQEGEGAAGYMGGADTGALTSMNRRVPTFTCTTNITNVQEYGPRDSSPLDTDIVEKGVGSTRAPSSSCRTSMTRSTALSVSAPPPAHNNHRMLPLPMPRPRAIGAEARPRRADDCIVEQLMHTDSSNQHKHRRDT